MVCAIIVTYNPDVTLLKEQRRLLIEQVDEIIYVDNASIDDVELCVDSSVVIKNSENLGLGRAQNQGIDLAIKINADFVLLLDQDSLPPRNFVNSLLQVYNECKLSKRVALVGPAIKNAYKEEDSAECGVVLKKTGLFDRIPLQRISEVSYCIASGSLIPVMAICEIGRIEERLFIDTLDLEWCLRAKHRGFVVIQTNATHLVHRLGEGSSDRILSHTPFREYFIVRNNIWLSRQPYIPLGYRCRKKCSIIVRLLLSVFRGRWDYVGSQLRGIKDGCRL